MRQRSPEHNGEFITCDLCGSEIHRDHTDHTWTFCSGPFTLRVTVTREGRPVDIDPRCIVECIRADKEACVDPA